MDASVACAACSKSQSDLSSGSLRACAALPHKSCQASHWPTHKPQCISLRARPSPSQPQPQPQARTPTWHDKHRKCQDGSEHEGALELITWDCPKERTGWGHFFREESADLKRKFEGEFGGDEERLYGYWPQGFRWTCCGTGGDMSWGCDHHGTGKKPCTCDFCRMGKPLPSKIYNEKSAERMGLSLSRGPDPRSGGNPALAAFTAMGRDITGLFGGL